MQRPYKDGVHFFFKKNFNEGTTRTDFNVRAQSSTYFNVRSCVNFA